MSCKVLSLNDANKWNSLLAKLPPEQQDIYYTPEYYKLYENYGDGKAQCFVFEKDGEFALYPYLINSVNELGYALDKEYFDIQGAYGYNGVVSSSYDKDFIECFYNAFNAYCIDNRIIAEFTRFHPLINNSIFSKNILDIHFDRKTVYVDLSKGYESIFADYQRTTRKQIRRASDKHGLTIQRFNNEVVSEFYLIYKNAMQHLSAIDYLLFNEDYFLNLLELKDSYCFVALQNDKIISAIITLQHKNYLHGHLGGTLQNYHKFSPFSLLYDEIIRYGAEIGCKYIHFGGGATSSEEDPVLNYKRHFSNDQGDFFIGKKIHNSNVYQEVTTQWQQKYPEKKEKYKNHLLKYRY